MKEIRGDAKNIRTMLGGVNFDLLPPPARIQAACDEHNRPIRSLISSLLAHRSILRQAHNRFLPRLMSGEVVL